MLENYWEDARNNIFQAEEKYSMARLMFSACSFLIIKRSKDLFLFPNLLTHWKIDTWYFTILKENIFPKLSNNFVFQNHPRIQDLILVRSIYNIECNTNLSMQTNTRRGRNLLINLWYNKWIKNIKFNNILFHLLTTAMIVRQLSKFLFFNLYHLSLTTRDNKALINTVITRYL